MKNPYAPSIVWLFPEAFLSHSESIDILSWPIENSRPLSSVQNSIISYVQHAPIALCVRELNRLFVYQALSSRKGTPKPSPVLDVGCGDGFWWGLQKAENVYGIDISDEELQQAAQMITATHVDISKEVPYPTLRFPQIIGNCSLEHVRDINAALKNLRASATEDAEFMLFVPTPSWAYQGLVQSFFLKKFPRLAMTVSGALNGFFQHWHLYDLQVWKALLDDNGWEIKETFGLGNSRSEFIYRLFLPPAFFGFLMKSIFGVYPNRLLVYVPKFLLEPFCRLLAWALKNPLVPITDPSAYEWVIVAKAK